MLRLSNAFENKDNREDQLLHVEHQARLCAEDEFLLRRRVHIDVDGFVDLLDVSEEDQRKYGQVASFSTSIRTRLAQYNGELKIIQPTNPSKQRSMLRRIKFHVRILSRSQQITTSLCSQSNITPRIRFIQLKILKPVKKKQWIS